MSEDDSITVVCEGLKVDEQTFKPRMVFHIEVDLEPLVDNQAEDAEEDFMNRLNEKMKEAAHNKALFDTSVS